MPSHQELGRRLLALISFDLRSLALLRIALGLVILLDLFIRSEFLELHYTNEGLFWHTDRFFFSARFSVHSLVHSLEYTQWLFIGAGILAVLLTLGIATPLVHLLSWLMLISLHYRNEHVLTEGDMLLRFLMFLTLFLPMGARFSVDALLFKRLRKLPDNFYSVWSLAYIFQMIIVYAVAGWCKFTWKWHSGLGAYYAMKLHTYAKPWAAYITGHLWLMRILSYYTLLIERIGWVVLLFHQRIWLWRLVAIFMFMTFHVGLALFMELGIFPLVGVIAWLSFLPTAIWDRFFPGTSVQKQTLPSEEEFSWKYHFFQFGKPWKMTVQFLGVFAIFLNIYSNFEVNDHWFYNIKPIDRVVSTFNLRQGWRVFSGPNTSDGWEVVVAQLEDGAELDLLTGKPVSWDFPGIVSGIYKNHRERKLARNIKKKVYLQRSLVVYLVKQWDARGGPRVDRATFYYMKEDILEDNTYGATEKVVGYEYVRPGLAKSED